MMGTVDREASMSDILKAIVIVVPLLGGIGLVFVCAQAIARNPNMSTSYAYVLGIAALLCVAPTLPASPSSCQEVWN